MTIRCARTEDAAALLAIYTPFVQDTHVSLEWEVPSVQEFAQRIASTLPRWPWLVCERDGAPVGYAYAGEHRSRKGYQYCTEVSVYIDAACRGQGIGRALYLALFDILRLQGYQNAYAGIGGDNAGSVAMHQALGFTLVGVYRNIGYKFGTWSDVSWWELALGSHPSDPPPVRPFPDLPPDQVHAILTRSIQ